MPVHAVIFDWGDTLMRDFPEYDGPMVRWPHVEAVEGAAGALEALRGRYLLAVASNAGASDASLMAAALERVGLREYFQFLFTSSELGARKPSAEFFRQLLAAMGIAAEEAVMVGDDYQADVVGARMAGLRAVWLRPGTWPEEEGTGPVIGSLAELPEVLRRLEAG